MSRTVIAPYDTSTLPCDLDGLDAEVVAAAATNASGYLWALSGRRVGRLTTIEEGFRTPCSDRCGMPYKDASGNWRNGGRGGHSCCRLELFRQPVVSIEAVRVFGVALDPSEFVVEGNSVLRLDACFPCCDDCDEPCVEVDYSSGTPLPKAPMDELICEMLAGATGGVCKLPSRLVSLTRQGVTMDLGDPSEFAEAGLTGMPITDAFIRTVNPNRLATRSRVLSPDLGRSTR